MSSEVLSIAYIQRATASARAGVRKGMCRLEGKLEEGVKMAVAEQCLLGGLLLRLGGIWR